MFSIIVPSFNRKDEIPALLESLNQQTMQDFEVVIVDDCSKQAVVVEQKYSFNVQVIRNEINQGAAESRNVGARNAQNDWLLFLDDDDRFANEKCQIIADVIKQNPDINFVYHPAQCEMVNEKFTYITRPYQHKEDLTIDNILLANKIGGMPMIGVKKDLFLKIGGLSNQLRSLEDYDFLLKILNEPSFNPKYIDKPLTHCTFHTKRSSVSTDTTNTEKAIQYIRDNYVQTAQQQKNFNLNAAYMLAYPHIMNLSRKAASYYFSIFQQSKNIKALIIALIVFISPKLAINLKRFI